MTKFNLTSKQLEAISQTAAKEALKAYQVNTKREKAQHKDWRLRNTKLLLKNYKLLDKHCSGIVDDLEDYENVIFDPEDLDLQTLMKYKARTKKMLNYFDSIWASYREYCKAQGGNVERRQKVIDKLYISGVGLRTIDVAVLYRVDESTIRRDEKKATDELSIFLFGIDSLEELTNAVFVP